MIRWATLLLLLPLGLLGQERCDLVVKGSIIDEATKEALEYANVYLEEAEMGVISDEKGEFMLSGICPGEYHLRITHIGCENQRLFLQIRSDTSLNIVMDHHDHVLHEVEVVGLSANLGVTQVRSRIDQENIKNNEGRSLGDLVEALPGVTALRTGAGISKPVIHGLSGNRIAVVQEGVNLTSQRWGSGHAPEVGLSTVETVTVIKGTEALEYGGEGLGGVVVMDAGSVPLDPHIHGWASLSGFSNGRGMSGSGQLEQQIGDWAWKLNLGATLSGDLQTPDHYLTNTGRRELHGGLHLFWNPSDLTSMKFYYIRYQNEIGVLRGAHIGNLTDLEMAFTREAPFFTNEDFSYQINAPRQDIVHHSGGLRLNHVFTTHWRGEGRYGVQVNQRDEYDVRRGGRTSVPSLSMALASHQASWAMIREKDGLLWKSGFQGWWAYNRNDSRTGILPLIPDHISTRAGAFSLLKWRLGNHLLEGGVRYDHWFNNIARVLNGGYVLREKRQFNNFMASAGWWNEVSDHFNWSINLGYTRRPPAINELYSFGLHQGVAGIEEGDPDLIPETALKAVARASYHTENHWLIEGAIYHQIIDDFIYLRPDQEVRLTIRGAFPVFRYTQTDARLSGWDLRIAIPVMEAVEAGITYSGLRGWDRENEDHLVFMPQDQVDAHIEWSFNGQATQGKLRLKGSYLFEQTRFPEDQDFLDPPEGYFLLGLEGDVAFKAWGQRWKAFGGVTNALDAMYRNYLNRWRYFADEIGRDVRLGLRWEF
jgi:iron complex outermembrane receptor protein